MLIGSGNWCLMPSGRRYNFVASATIPDSRKMISAKQGTVNDIVSGGVLAANGMAGVTTGLTPIQCAPPMPIGSLHEEHKLSRPHARYSPGALRGIAIQCRANCVPF